MPYGRRGEEKQEGQDFRCTEAVGDDADYIKQAPRRSDVWGPAARDEVPQTR